MSPAQQIELLSYTCALLGCQALWASIRVTFLRRDHDALQQQCDRLTDRVRTLEESRSTDATRPWARSCN